MGHTVWSQRIVQEVILKELASFSKALRKEDREHFHRMLKKPLKHMGSISYTNSYHAWAFLILAIILEQEKRNEMADRCIQSEEEDCAMDKRRKEKYKC